MRDASHELRSPLTRLNLALELARQKPTMEAAGPLDRIERESGRLNKLIGQLLTLARLDADSQHAGGDVNVVNLLKAIVEDAQIEAARRQVSVQLAKFEPCSVRGHVDTLYTALENVIRNALRHTEQGTSVEITLDSAEIADGVEVVVRVRDQGPGVPEDELASVLQPFYTVDLIRRPSVASMDPIRTQHTVEFTETRRCGKE